jgi:hypothetical protein
MEHQTTGMDDEQARWPRRLLSNEAGALVAEGGASVVVKDGESECKLVVRASAEQ